MTKITRRRFNASAGALAVSTLTIGKGGLAGAAEPQPYPIAPEVATTSQRTVLPAPKPATTVHPTEVAKYAPNGYGVWNFGPKLDAAKRLDLMASTYAGDAAQRDASLLRFFAITDIHITDKESPSSAIYLGVKHGLTSAYSPVMLDTTHVLDAAIQTVNALHQQAPIDFGLSLGDTCNNTQYNELRWYLDVIDGKVITPSSGARVGAKSPDYQKPYKAVGLDKAIKWYQAIGNHDHFWLGTSPVDDYLRQVYVGDEIIKIGDIILDPAGITKRTHYQGVLDGMSEHGDIVGAGPVDSFAQPQKVVPDPLRRSLTKKEWMAEFFRTTTEPVGHGFSQANIDDDFACYSFRPKAGVPLKVIVLDNTQTDDDVSQPMSETSSPGWAHGSLDRKRYDWLVQELDDGQAKGELMIIAAHIPIAVEPAKSLVGWSSVAFVSEPQLIAKLHEYPNLIMFMAGHRHYNVIKPFVSPDPARPELGFWQVETASLRDFPQQFRLFEIALNSDDTVSILTTDVDPAVKAGTPAAQSRCYAVATEQIFATNNLTGMTKPLRPTGSDNAELVVPLGADMGARLRRAAGGK